MKRGSINALGLFISILLASLLAISCGGNETPDENPTPDEPAPTPVEDVTPEPDPVDEPYPDLDMLEPEDPGMMVEIPDGNLELVLRKAIGDIDTPLTAGDLATITRLEGPNSGIGNLEGLEYCINLEELFVGANVESDDLPNYIWDLAPITDLTKLRSLDIQGNRVFDLSPIANHVELRNLNFSNNGLEDISVLANMPHLEDLLIAHNKIGDISALANCPEIVNLWAQKNEIADISALSGLENLSKVFLDGNLIRDITPLVENPGIGERDQIFLSLNPLTEESATTHIEILEDRGAFVTHAMSSGG